MDHGDDPCIIRRMSDRSERFLVFAGMRDEGAFLVEWISWYRMMGFEILIGVNDCTDRSPALLEAFAQEGWIEWFEHKPPHGTPPKQSAHRHAQRHPATARTDWLLICDVDEFLVLHRGDGTIGSYLDDLGRDHLGVAFHWQCFGTGGWKRYQPGLVHRQFRRRGPSRRPVNVMVKTMFRTPQRFGRWSDHMPWEFEGEWDRARNRIVDSEGRTIEALLTEPHPVRFTDVEQITHSYAQMNHYVLRSVEQYDMKRGTPSATAAKDRYTQTFFERRDRNGRRDLAALAHAEAFDRVHAEAMALPGVARLHHLCCADLVARLCAHQGRSPSADPRWRAAIEAAEAAG
jgi:hypothetical protein